MKKCPYCGRSNNPYENTCWNCKAALPHDEKQEEPKQDKPAETEKPLRNRRR